MRAPTLSSLCLLLVLGLVAGWFLSEAMRPMARVTPTSQPAEKESEPAAAAFCASLPSWSTKRSWASI